MSSALAPVGTLRRDTVSCALCTSDRWRLSWLGTTVYHRKEFTYLECLACGSLFCHPMPDEATLAEMYGSDYAANPPDAAVDDPKEPQRVVQWLRAAGSGTFIDYGCGGGVLLAEAQRLGWIVVGFEFEPEVAAAVERRVGIRVVDRRSRSELRQRPAADALHLGDVLEHLTDPGAELPEVLRLIKPGGHLLAQGPLEANPTLFTLLLRAWRRVRKAPPAEMAPYHVTLATAKGQKTLFARVGLETVEFSMHEVDWPAPSTLSWSDIRGPRRVGLFFLRRLSRAVTALAPRRFGNRYFYVGRWPGFDAPAGTRPP